MVTLLRFGSVSIKLSHFSFLRPGLFSSQDSRVSVSKEKQNALKESKLYICLFATQLVHCDSMGQHCQVNSE